MKFGGLGGHVAACTDFEGLPDNVKAATYAELARPYTPRDPV